MKYFLANKLKSISIIIIVILSIFTVYLITALVQAVFKTGEDSLINALSEFSIITTKGNNIGIDEKTWNYILSQDSVEQIYNAYCEETSISNIFGTTSSFVIFLSENDLNKMFSKSNFKLITGKMPSPLNYEIIMHETILKNKKLAIGDNLELSSGTYKIVGSYSGNSMLTLGIKNHKIEQYIELGSNIENVHFAGIVIPKNSLEDMNFMIDEIDNSDFDSWTASDLKRQFKEQSKSFSVILSIIVFVVISSISSAIGVVLNTLYNGRIDEFGILNAIGYNKKRIISKYILKEISLLIVFSWICGMIFSGIVLKIIDYKIFKPMGQTMPIFNIQSLLYTVVSLVVILIIAVVPIVVKLSKTDLISVIERR